MFRWIYGSNNNESPKPYIPPINERIKQLYKLADETTMHEHKIWCYALIFFLSEFADKNGIVLTRESGKIHAVVVEELAHYYSCNGKEGIQQMLCCDIGKDMMDNYRGEENQSTFYCDAAQLKTFKAKFLENGCIAREIDSGLATLRKNRDPNIEPIFVIGVDGMLYLCYEDQS